MDYGKVSDSGLEELYGLAIAYFETVAEWQQQERKLGDSETTKFHLANIQEFVKRLAPPFSKYGPVCCGKPYPQAQCQDCPMVEHLNANPVGNSGAKSVAYSPPE